MKFEARKFGKFFIFLIGVVAGLALLKVSWGAAVFASAIVFVVFAVLALRECVRLAFPRGGARLRSGLLKALLVVVSALLALALCEIGLRWRDRVVARAVLEGRLSPTALISLPPEWENRRVEVEGARRAYYWHGKLHVHRANRMRGLDPFPVKTDDTFTVMAVGDSLTLGMGVDATEAWPARLESGLSEGGRARVANLGVCGDQSEDVLRVVGEFLPTLNSDLVVYGVCVNDLLPSNERENIPKSNWALPLPGRVKLYFTTRVLFFNLMERRYDSFLMRRGLRPDFIGYVMDGYEERLERFRGDVRRMNALATGAGKPPVMAILLLVANFHDERYPRVLADMEGALRDAGMTVVESARYLPESAGKYMAVSFWEGHPNPEAHRVFAKALREEIEKQAALDKCRARQPRRETPADRPDPATAAP
jgi:lysophospholipase L1-like esterase